MDEGDSQAKDWAGHQLATELSDRIRDVISAAEAAAGAIRHEAEDEAQTRRRRAEAESKQLVEDARRDADALLAERRRRIAELSDTLLERGETVLARLDRAAEVKRELESLADALGKAAIELAEELQGGPTSTGGVPPAVRGDAGSPPPGIRPTALASEAPEDRGAVTSQSNHREAISSETPTVEDTVSSPAAPALDGTSDSPSPPADIRDEGPRSVSSELEQTHEANGETDDDTLAMRLVALQMAVAGSNRGEVANHLRRTFDVVAPEAILDDVFGPGTDPSKRVAFPSTGEI